MFTAWSIYFTSWISFADLATQYLSHQLSFREGHSYL